MALTLVGDRKPFPFLQGRFDEQDAHFSPDGRWIAYFSNESGKFEVYVASFPAADAAAPKEVKWQVSIKGGRAVQYRGIFIPSRLGLFGRVGRPAFLTSAVAEPEPPSYITVVLNWAAGLRKQ